MTTGSVSRAAPAARSHRDLLRDDRGRLDLRSLGLEALCDWVEAELGLRRERGVDLWKSMWLDGHADFLAMRRFAREHRERMAERAYLSFLEPALILKSEDGTRKFLWRLEDGRTIESVLIPDEDRRLTLCMSSQVGCAMACSFCLTGDLGLIRHLKPSEIANQVLQVNRLLPAGQRITNLVFMGMGEPVHNLENLLVALEICQDNNALNMSHRRITVSTVGLVPKLLELSRRSPVNLAISLNATTEASRREIMPITRKHSLQELMDACRSVALPSGKRIAFEYVLFEGENDSFEDMQRILDLTAGIPRKINLIPYNVNPDRALGRPADEHVKALQHFFISRGVNCTIRTTRGTDISAACGQLGKAWEQAVDRGWMEAARAQLGEGGAPGAEREGLTG